MKIIFIYESLITIQKKVKWEGKKKTTERDKKQKKKKQSKESKRKTATK